MLEILRAAEWKSAAFACYVDLEAVESGAVLEAHYVASDAEEE